MNNKTYWAQQREYERNKIKKLPEHKIEISGNYEIMSYPQERGGKQIYIIIAFRGKAGKPFHNYYYTDKERFLRALDKLKEAGIKEIERKEERKRKNKGKLTGHALVAKLIRQKLKNKYPDVKFSVRSESFAGGNAVNIHWENGPTFDQINRLTKIYEYGHFDGMQDLYIIDRKLSVDENGKIADMPGVKYVMAERTITDNVYNSLIERIKKDFAIENDEQAREILQTTLQNYAYRIIQKISLVDITLKDFLKLDNIYNLSQNNIYNQ